MTRLHLKRGSSRRTSALGLVLSLALIFSASGIIGVGAAEPKDPCSQIEETAGSEAQERRSGSYTVSPGVRGEGHHEEQRNL
ncbi:MAG: hypothetical protein F4087_03965 [Gemmatimonadetes bacterium]|nr:hypothetical protein [Gemmatimonadota bacterium]MXX34895.1 hypothetical protein [Gemmatimonadota bacterium]MYA12501.1 hypothetical protein [Gemmatimonadota bacterium]MYD14310.1 hypothetical protein [Gemmatimonadota bacterium]MYE69683.1 hypothetical protein [Gemmatimonadota bacterium]